MPSDRPVMLPLPLSLSPFPGKKSQASVHAFMTTAASSVGVSSPAKELALKQEAQLLHTVEGQIREATALLKSLYNERIPRTAV